MRIYRFLTVFSRIPWHPAAPFWTSACLDPTENSRRKPREHRERLGWVFLLVPEPGPLKLILA